jgi:hypothetical protein
MFFIELIKKARFIFLALILTACSSAAPNPNAADIDTEEQAVYAFFVGGSKETVIIMRETNTNISQDSPEKTLEYIKSGLPSISKETIDSYLERNSQPEALSPDMKLDSNYQLVPADEIYKVTSQPNWDVLFSEKYNGAHGYTVFSRVGFNASLDQAVVYVGNVSGPLMGAGYYYLMEKKDGQWLIKEQVMAWIS